MYVVGGVIAGLLYRVCVVMITLHYMITDHSRDDYASSFEV